MIFNHRVKRKKGIFKRFWMTKLVFIKKEDKKGIFKHPRRTNYFLPKRGRMVTLYTCNARKIELHQSIAASTWWCGPQPRLGWVKIAVGLSEGPIYPGHSPHTNHFFACSPLNDRRRVARSLFKIGLSSPAFLLPVSSFFSFS